MVTNTSNNFNAPLNTKLFDFLRIKLLWIWMKSTHIQKKIYWAIVPNAKIINFIENDILFIKIQWICHFVIINFNLFFKI